MATSPDEAVEFLRIANDADSHNRIAGEEALRFRYGDQWPRYAVASRGLDRPQLTINETNTYIKKVTNAQRQQRPRGKASPVDSYADKKIAKVITGLGRHVEVNSDADNAVDTAFDFSATIGWGYWRINTRLTDDQDPKCIWFNIQDVFVDSIWNPFTVSFDPNSHLPDGSDSEKTLITDLMPKTLFREKWPGAIEANFVSQDGQKDADWITEHDIRLAEFFKVERVKTKLLMLSNGTPMWEDQVKRLHETGILLASGITVQGERESLKRSVQWCKQTAHEILEEKTLPGRWIPIVPVYWTRVMIDGKDTKRGLVYDAMDPARMNNFWQTAITEYLALAPKAKWLIVEGQDEGHEKEFAGANMSSSPVLRYKPTDVNGQPAPAPQRIAPEMPPSGFIEAAFMANQNLSRVMGIFDPAVRGGAQHKSDKTLNAEQGQSENTNFDGYDNLTRSIKHSWRIMLSYFPVVYDTQRVQRIIGEDGRDEMVTLNEKGQGEDGIAKVLNDVTVGTYDVVMQTGPGYETKRQEGVAAKMELLNTPLGEKIAQVGDDLIVREMDFNGSDALADRLAAANPMAQIDEKDDVPPKVQMMVKGLQQQLQQAQQVIQKQADEIRLRGGIADKRNQTDLAIAHMGAVVKAHDTETWAAQDGKESQADNETKVLVEEIKGHIALLLARIDERKEKNKIDGEEKDEAITHPDYPGFKAKKRAARV
jgi:hypothetical protein